MRYWRVSWRSRASQCASSTGRDARCQAETRALAMARRAISSKASASHATPSTAARSRSARDTKEAGPSLCTSSFNVADGEVAEGAEIVEATMLADDADGA